MAMATAILVWWFAEKRMALVFETRRSLRPTKKPRSGSLESIAVTQYWVRIPDQREPGSTVRYFVEPSWFFVPFVFQGADPDGLEFDPRSGVLWNKPFDAVMLLELGQGFDHGVAEIASVDLDGEVVDSHGG